MMQSLFIIHNTKIREITVYMFWLHDLSSFDKRLVFFFLNVRWNYCIVKNFVCSYVMPVVWIFILLLKERKNPTDPLSHFKSARLHVH